MQKEWQLSYVTPLHHFRHTQLRSYSRQLLAFIVAEKQQGLAVALEGAESSLKVVFSVVEGMAMTDDDADTVLIQVSTKSVDFSRLISTRMIFHQVQFICRAHNH